MKSWVQSKKEYIYMNIYEYTYVCMYICARIFSDTAGSNEHY